MSDDDRRRLRTPAELPQSIAPSRDLWPAISRAIAATPQDAAGAAAGAPRADAPARRDAVVVAGPAPRRRARAWAPALGLAATVACVGFGVWVGRATAPRDPAPAAAALSTALAPGARFARERQALLVEAGLGLSRLSPEERRRIEASLATLRQAIADIRRALGEDPGNLLLQEMLVNSHQEEIRVLTAVKEAGVAGQET
jgi:hypothetical protein